MSPGARGLPLVAVPGLALSGRTLEPLLDALAGHPGAVAEARAVDPPGAGATPDDPRHRGVEGQAAAVLAWCAARGLDRVVLLGHSVGAQVALAAAAAEPARVAAVVLSAPTGDPAARRLPRLVGRWLADGLREPVRQVPRLVRDWLRADPRAAAALAAGMRTDDVLARAARVTCPALVLRGGADAIAPQDWVEELVRRLPGGRLTVLPGLPHNALVLDPAGAAAAVAGFVEREAAA